MKVRSTRKPSTAPGVIGRRVSRLEGIEKVTGRALYSADVRLKGQLYARVLRSALPHARIRRITTARAEALPGVRVVLSCENAPDIPWYEESRLFDSTVRFAGEEVVAVAADTDDIAQDALRLIDVEYEALPFSCGFDGQVEEPSVQTRGDVERGARAAEVIIDQSYSTPTALHNCMEPHGCTADWNDGALTLYESTQGVFAVRSEVAGKLGLPEQQVRVIAHHVGGGFGSKQTAWKHAVIAALLSRRAGRPVQLMLDREAENLATGNRNATRQQVRLGARRDGTLAFIEARILIDAGAYLAGGEASEVSGIYHTLYRCPNVRTEQRAVRTNAGPAIAFRAPGYVEGAFALESAMDELARALGVDAVDLRLRNYASDDQDKQKPYSSPDSLRRCYAAVTEAFGWKTHRRRDAEKGSKRRGIGFAAHVWPGGAGFPPATACVRLDASGLAHVITGTQDIGTGTRTGLAQIAAEALGFPLERIVFHLGETADAPYAPTSAGSATQATLGPAVQAAAADARRGLLAAAEPLLGEAAGDVLVRDGALLVASKSGKTVPVQDVCEAASAQAIEGRGERGPNPKDRAVRTFGAQCVELEVDIETGDIEIVRVLASHDCGRLVNPMLVDSQVIGGVTQGIGFALSEARRVDARSGTVLNANLEEYKLPTIADVPPIVNAQPDLPDYVANDTGAKGIGEPPIIPTAPAIANALFDAAGVRLRDLPLTRRRLIEALAAQQGDGD
jgi:CO/xanthine dehydrogenase Mo-binding subunit